MEKREVLQDPGFDPTSGRQFPAENTTELFTGSKCHGDPSSHENQILLDPCSIHPDHQPQSVCLTCEGTPIVCMQCVLAEHPLPFHAIVPLVVLSHEINHPLRSALEQIRNLLESSSLRDEISRIEQIHESQKSKIDMGKKNAKKVLSEMQTTCEQNRNVLMRWQDLVETWNSKLQDIIHAADFDKNGLAIFNAAKIAQRISWEIEHVLGDTKLNEVNVSAVDKKDRLRVCVHACSNIPKFQKIVLIHKHVPPPSFSTDVLASEDSALNVSLWTQVSCQTHSLLDFHFIFPDRTKISAHRNILTARNEFFNAMLGVGGGTWSDSGSSIFQIDDFSISPTSLFGFLEFLDLEQINLKNSIFVFELFHLGKYFSSPELCEMLLAKNSAVEGELSVIPAVEALTHFGGAENPPIILKQKIFSEFLNFTHAQMSQLSQNGLITILKIVGSKNEISCFSPGEIFKVVWRWCNANKMSSDIDPEILGWIPFGKMSLEIFEKIVVGSGIVNEEFLCKIREQIPKTHPKFTTTILPLLSIPQMDIQSEYFDILPSESLIFVRGVRQLQIWDYSAKSFGGYLIEQYSRFEVSGETKLFGIDWKHNVWVSSVKDDSKTILIPKSETSCCWRNLAHDSFRKELHLVDPDKNRISVFSSESGKFLFEYGHDHYLNRPISVAVDGELGLVFVTNQAPSNICVFTTQGNFVKSFGQDFLFVDLWTPISLDKKNGRVVAIDRHSEEVKLFGYDGQFLHSFECCGVVSCVKVGNGGEIFARTTQHHIDMVSLTCE